MVEVLVVILIVTVLASILMPVVASSKQSAQKVGCISNMRQLYAGVKLYQVDYGEYPPCNGQCEQVVSYTKAILSCPDSRPARLAPGSHGNDYLLMGHPMGARGFSTSAQREAREALKACLDKRQGDIPLVMDPNHVPGLLTLTDDHSFYYITRENGGVSRVSVRAALSAPVLCDGSKISSEYNY